MKTKIITIISLILLALAVTGCNHEENVIFYDIAREVKLVNAEINGKVFTIVPLDGKLYVQNGYIYEKADTSSPHGWRFVAKPVNSGNIVRLASDGNTLYALDTTESGVKKDVYACAAGSTIWTKIATDVDELFDNQVTDSNLNTTGRKAYITKGSQVFELSGTSTTPTPVTAQDTFGKETAKIKAAVFNGTDTVFSSNSAICVCGANLYSADNLTKTIKYSTDGGASWSNGCTVTDNILSICAYGTTTILAGTENGYEICAINSTTGKPANGVNSTTNAETAFGRNRQVISINAFGQTVYAGITATSSSAYSKLWGWFGTDWNYE